MGDSCQDKEHQFPTIYLISSIDRIYILDNGPSIERVFITSMVVSCMSYGFVNINQVNSQILT